MKTLFLDLSMGAAGDMLSAALLELLPAPGRNAFLDRLNAAGIPGVRATLVPSVRCGITGSSFVVDIGGEVEGHGHHHGHDHDHDHGHGHGHGHHHEHHGMGDIAALISSLAIPPAVRTAAIEVYRRIAEAEAAVHGRPVDQVHFHEVGALDAVADIVAVCWLVSLLAPDTIVATPVNTGGGTVRCAHGILPVPAPATARLLRGVPVYDSGIPSELCTPTGAALVVHFVQRFGPMPAMSISAIGYGMGQKEFERANCLRALLGGSASAPPGADSPPGTVVHLQCELDDITPEALAFACERLFEAGALDVFTVPALMKKGRPAFLLTVIAAPADEARLVSLVFRHTTTLGLRIGECRRAMLERRIETLQTPAGPVRKKIAEGYGVVRSKLEYDDLAAIAASRGISLAEAAALAEAAPAHDNADHPEPA
jgi:uncharacterized protein (TIGR00299 family) protein